MFYGSQDFSTQNLCEREREKVGISQTVDRQEFIEEFRKRTSDVKDEEYVKNAVHQFENDLENLRICKILNPNYPKSFYE